MVSKYAWKFGMLEHTTSRVLFVSLIASYALYCAQYPINIWYSIGQEVPAMAWLLRVNILLWLAYWSFHRLEKFFFKRGR